MPGLRRLRGRLSRGSHFRRLRRVPAGCAALAGYVAAYWMRGLCRMRCACRMRRMAAIGKKAAFLVFLALAGFPAGGQEFPLILQLNARDPVFRQYEEDVGEARKLIFGRQGDARRIEDGFRIYSYAPSADDDMYSLASRCNIPQSSIAGLNRLGNPSPLPQTLMLPNRPGLFIPEDPQNDLEMLMASSRNMEDGIHITINGAGFRFFPGKDFEGTERIYFLRRGFRFPLQNYRITSTFGIRPSPFTGRPQRHAGLDLAAPAGTSVYPTREGLVSETGADSLYGNYIVIAHNDGWASLYGHLSAVLVKNREKVGRGMVIGRVGSTGQSTGPHLHFEIRKNGTAMDPGKLLFRQNEASPR